MKRFRSKTIIAGQQWVRRDNTIHGRADRQANLGGLGVGGGVGRGGARENLRAGPRVNPEVSAGVDSGMDPGEFLRGFSRANEEAHPGVCRYGGRHPKVSGCGVKSVQEASAVCSWSQRRNDVFRVNQPRGTQW